MTDLFGDTGEPGHSACRAPLTKDDVAEWIRREAAKRERLERAWWAELDRDWVKRQKLDGAE